MLTFIIVTLIFTILFAVFSVKNDLLSRIIIGVSLGLGASLLIVSITNACIVKFNTEYEFRSSKHALVQIRPDQEKYYSLCKYNDEIMFMFGYKENNMDKIKMVQMNMIELREQKDLKKPYLEKHFIVATQKKPSDIMCLFILKKDQKEKKDTTDIFYSLHVPQ